MSQRGNRFQHRMGLAGDLAYRLHHVVGLGKALLNVPFLHANVTRRVPAVLQVIVNVDRIFRQAVSGIEVRRKRFILDLDEVQSLQSDLVGHGGYGGHLVPHVPNLVIEDELVIGRRIRRRMSRRREGVPGHVVRCDDGLDAGQRARLGRVDVDDSGMGVGAPKDLAVQHAREGHIHRVHAGPGCLVGGVLQRQALSNDLESLHEFDLLSRNGNETEGERSADPIPLSS